MKTVVVRPERCVSCMQCRFQCAVAHSRSKSEYFSHFEEILSKPRIHIVMIENSFSFPNKCRHCDPAPCESACITKAVYRESKTNIVLINPDKCINCGMCAMACPFGVIRYHVYPNRKIAAHKCDQCILRQSEGDEPACVSACKVGALSFEDVNVAMAEDSEKTAKLVYLGIREKGNITSPFEILKDYKKQVYALNSRRR